MNIAAPAVLVSARVHGENASIARFLTEQHGLVAAYVAGGRGRRMRPIMIPGNLVAAELRSKSDNQLPFARIELAHSRAQWMTEPLPAAAISWICALTASCLPERSPFPNIYAGINALLDAVCHAPAARDWIAPLLKYEAMLLNELGYGFESKPKSADFSGLMQEFSNQGSPIARHLLVDSYGDVMAARRMLGDKLSQIAT